MNVKEYIEKHNINLPLEAVEEFEMNLYSVCVEYQQRTNLELNEAINLLLDSFRVKYGMSPVVKHHNYGTTGVLDEFIIKIACQGDIRLIPKYATAYPVEVDTTDPTVLSKCKTESIIEDQVPVLAEEVAQLELQAKFESYSKKQWITTNYGIPARFLGVLKNSEQPFILVASSLEDGKETVFTLREDLREFDYDDHPAIKENSPYADWPMDAKVRYWDGAYERHAHYAGTDENGNATVWRSWGTSWTTQERFCPEFVELVEDLK